MAESQSNTARGRDHTTTTTGSGWVYGLALLAVVVVPHLFGLDMRTIMFAIMAVSLVIIMLGSIVGMVHTLLPAGRNEPVRRGRR